MGKNIFVCFMTSLHKMPCGILHIFKGQMYFVKTQ